MSESRELKSVADSKPAVVEVNHRMAVWRGFSATQKITVAKLCAPFAKVLFRANRKN
jgi:hypothetical protein